MPLGQLDLRFSVISFLKQDKLSMAGRAIVLVTPIVDFNWGDFVVI